MFKEVQLSDIEQGGLLHSRVEKFMFNSDKKTCILQINFIRLKIQGSFYSCTITITDWWNISASFTRGGKELNIDGLADLISNNPIDNAIYEYIIDENDITLNGHVSDCLFSLKFTKPKIQITGEYDAD